MNLRPMPPGAPGADLGVAHLLKHWCSPHEMWEDIADGVPPELRPAALVARFGRDGEAPIWEQASNPGPALRQDWAVLQQAYSHGYFACIHTLVRGLPDPPHRPFRRDPTRRGVHLAHVGEGVLLYIRQGVLYTAFRPVDFKLSSHDCPPRDANSVSLRRQIAPVFARKKLARI